MRTYKIVLSVCLALLAVAGAYGAFMYVYTDSKFAPVPLLQAPQTQAPHSDYTAPHVRFIHQVNTPARARRKDGKFGGFEVDVWAQNNHFLAAHDAQEAARNIPLSAIFEAVKYPAQKVWWLDLKQELTAEQVDALVQLAGQFGIPKEHLLFEASAGPTAQLISQKKLHLLLQLPEGFEEDENDPQKRAELNAQALVLWQEYQPAAVSASFGKYGHLKAYFPNMPKAIYYSATVRPSLKKNLMSAKMKQDPSVLIFMVDEYTWVNL